MKTYKNFKDNFNCSLTSVVDTKFHTTAIEEFSRNNIYNNKCQVMFGLVETEIKPDDFYKDIILFYKKLVGESNITISSDITKIAATFTNWMFQRRVYKAFKDNDKIIEIPEVSYNKGFLILGKPGNGKTTLLQAFSLTCNKYRDYIKFYNHSNQAQFIPVKVKATSIQRNFLLEGVQGIDRYSIINIASTNDEKLDLSKRAIDSFNMPNRSFYPVLYIDDLATGTTLETMKTYGSSFDVFDYILKTRYDEDLITFVTGNIFPASLQESTLDRFNTMFNVIKFEGESYRK